MSTFFRRGVLGTGIAVLLIGAAAALAANKMKTPPSTPATSPNEHFAYLGVGVESMYPPLASHMPEQFRDGQGVLVASVVSGSPAEKAGIKPDDVLMTYGDQKLFAPEQLAKLIRGDTIGRKVDLSLVRQGKVEQVTATLGEHQAPSPSPEASSQPNREWWSWWGPERQPRLGRVPQGPMHATNSGDKDTRWQSFDSMTIKNLGNDRFKAEIQYLNKEGKVEQQNFEGTRDEIHKEILAQKDLPDNEREQLLRSLDIPGGELVIPGFHAIPGHGFTWEFAEPSGSL